MTDHLDANNWGVMIGGPKDHPMDTFDVGTLKFPHPVGWCVEQSIDHHWRHVLVHTFTGPVRSQSERYCINCGQRQSRTPEHTVPATPWKNSQ